MRATGAAIGLCDGREGGVDVRGLFTGAVDPPEQRTAQAWWFAFVADRLVIYEPDGGSEVPYVAEPEEIGLVPEARHYLGLLDGRDCWALDLGADLSLALPEGYQSRNMRGIYGRIDDDLFSLAGRGVQIVEWGRNHRFCGRCGQPTEAMPGERAKKCPACGLITYPRLSPAVIVQITRDSKILLARNASFPGAFYSVLAGFVEAGESLEATVRREIREEVGIEVTDIQYFGSQPWPFPNSLMLGFKAKWAAGEITVDPRELADANWFSHDALPNIPARLSIARRLIDDFIVAQGGELE